MCPECDIIELEGEDLLSRFVQDETSLDYYDGPLSGWMSCRSCADWFAFDCMTIIDGLLWHWAIVPYPRARDAQQSIRDASTKPDAWWLSLTEDRRTATQERQRVVRIFNSLARPPLLPVRSPRVG